MVNLTVRRDEYIMDRIAEVLVTSWSGDESSSGRVEKDGSNGGSSGSREGERRERSRDKRQVVGGADAGSLVISKLLHKHHPHMRLFSFLPASLSLPHNIAPPPTQPLESAAAGEEAAKEKSAREASALAPTATSTAPRQLAVNSTASWLAGCEVRGPAVVAVVEASWSDSRRGEMEEEGVVAWDVYRLPKFRRPGPSLAHSHCLSVLVPPLLTTLHPSTPPPTSRHSQTPYPPLSGVCSPVIPGACISSARTCPSLSPVLSASLSHTHTAHVPLFLLTPPLSFPSRRLLARQPRGMRLLARQPRGMYQLSLEAPVLASLPLSFSSTPLWRGKHPKSMLLELCTMQRAIDSSPMCMGMCGFKTEHQQQQEQEQQQGKDGRQDQEQKDEDREKAQEEQEGQRGQCCCEHKSMQLAVGDPVFEFPSPSGSLIPTTTATTTGTGIGTGQGSGGASGGTSSSNTTNGNGTAVNSGGFKCRVTINRGPSSPPLVALSPRRYAARMDAVHAACLEALRAIQKEYAEVWGRVVDPWGAWGGEGQREEGEEGEDGERMEICTGDGNGGYGEEREEKEREEEKREEEEDGDGRMARKRLKEVEDSSPTRAPTSAVPMLGSTDAVAALGSSPRPSPSSSSTPAALGCLVSISYRVSLQQGAKLPHGCSEEVCSEGKEEVCLESKECFEFEFGRGCVDERIEAVIGRLLPGQTADIRVPIRGHLPPFPALEAIQPATGPSALHWRITLLSVAAAEEEDRMTQLSSLHPHCLPPFPLFLPNPRALSPPLAHHSAISGSSRGGGSNRCSHLLPISLFPLMHPHLPNPPTLPPILPLPEFTALHCRVTLLSVAAAEEEDRIDAAIFSPSLSKQRLAFAAALISKHSPAFLLDVGCGSASLFDYLLSASAAASKGSGKAGSAGCDNGSGSSAERFCLPASMVGFDISQKELERAGRSLTRTITSLQAASQPAADAATAATQVEPAPETTCTVAARAASARLALYAGSLADVDDRMKDADVATCLEVVEHLDEEPLAAFGAVVLGALRPRVLLQPQEAAGQAGGGKKRRKKKKGQQAGQQADQTGQQAGQTGQQPQEQQQQELRNSDHRFEWTREEFESWANALAQEYGYHVTFGGVGVLPEAEHLGFATQTAVFERATCEMKDLGLGSDVGQMRDLMTLNPDVNVPSLCTMSPASSLSLPSRQMRDLMTLNPDVMSLGRGVVYWLPPVAMRDLMTLNPDVMSLGQGVVYWLPPDAVLAAAQAAVHDPVSSGYGVDDGTKELRAALVEKVKTENGLMDSSIMVTAGANQAFVNVVLTLCDPDDAVVLFKPFYFNHQMAFQMTGVTDIVYGPCDSDTLHPSADWLEEALSGKEGRKVPKVVVITNPNNPTGTYVPEDLLRRISAICEKAGSWLVLDNTYEYFMYGGNRHVCLEAPHVLNIFSFSKAYGMMGWRVGYIAYPNSSPGLGPSLIKAQDTIPICANLIGQQAALAALQSPSAGKPFVDRLIQTLSPNLEEARDALAMLTGPGVGGRVWGGEGAIYLWAKLPEGCEDDGAVVRWLVSEHGVVVIPGSASGAPGHIRVSFANLPAEKYKVAAGRLKKGLQELVEKGMRFPLSQ
ncbi:unnamed protein product [Closterium sp. NIES-65]|nr:unnamed protein product [Closterium sp. NIES-65]